MNKTYFELEEDFKNIITDALPSEKIESLEQISTGWTNIVYHVKTNNAEYFFRFPRDEFWSRTIVKDCEFASYIHGKTDFNTVNLQLKYDKNGRPFSMHKKIEGTALAEKMNDLSEEDVKGISKDIAKFMYQLHNVKYDKGNIFKINNIGLKLEDFLDELLTLHVSKEDIEFWKDRRVNEDTNYCLVHGDLNSSNVLINENNRVTAFIDFGFGGFGNKYDDISRIIGRTPIKFKNNIIESYEEYSNSALDMNSLNKDIDTWNKIDSAYINYMRKIGIYE